MNSQEVIAKIEREYTQFLDRQKMINIIIKRYTESQSPEHKITITQTIGKCDESLNYSTIIDEVKKRTIAKIKEAQNEVLNFQEIETEMQQEVVTKIEEQNNKLKEKAYKQEDELSKGQAKLESNKQLKQGIGLLRESADSFRPSRERRQLPTPPARSANTSVSNKVTDLFQNLTNYSKILTFEKSKELFLEVEKQRLSMMAKDRTSEDIVSKLQETVLKIIDLYQKHQEELKGDKLTSMVFSAIHFYIIHEPKGEQFIADNFSKIIQFGFKDQEPEGDLITLIQRIVDKLKTDDKLPLHEKMESNYQYMLDQHEEIHDQLAKLKEKCSSKGLYKEFYVFIDFIYSSEEAKKKQNLENELQREKAASELLEAEAKETGCKLKQPQQKKKKKNKSRNKNSSSKTIINDKANEPEDSKKEEFENKEVKELREELHELIKLKFPNQESKGFEHKVKKAIFEFENQQSFENQKNLYCIIIDLYLGRVACRIKDYNDKYGKTITETKGEFGTEKFDWKLNKLITSHLGDIASIIKNMDIDLKAAHLILDKITLSVYKDSCNQYQSDNNDQRRLEMTGEENRILLSKFLDHLQALGEWHTNKLCVVKERGIYSKKKSDRKRINEKEALSIIKLCINSLDVFLRATPGLNDVSTELQDNRCETIEYYGPYQSWEYYGPHQQWCVLSRVNVEGLGLSDEIKRCSC